VPPPAGWASCCRGSFPRSERDRGRRRTPLPLAVCALSVACPRVIAVPRIKAENLPAHRQQVHEHVFAAFAELMAERSYDSITMAQLAEHAGLGRTAIYHHFHDKDAVVVAFATHETERYVSSLEDVLSTTDDPAEQLRLYVRNHLDSGERFHMGLGPQLYGVLPASSAAEIREHVVAVEQVLRSILAAGVDQGVFTVEDPRATMSLIHACLTPRHLPAGAVEEFVLHAVSATAPASS
jgi:AcrR family transcriptional regulator